MERNLKILVAYDGTNYHGFQRQNNAKAIQNILEMAFEKLFKQPITLVGSGRTDTGVHAYGQTISLSVNTSIPAERIPRAVKKFLPDDIVVIDACDVAEDFNARFSCVGKAYEYHIFYSEVVNPLKRNFVWQVAKKPDLSLLCEVSALIVGEHDFASFRSMGSSKNSTVREIYQAKWHTFGQEFIFHISGNGFLYHMVRNLVGTMYNVGIGKISVEDFKNIMAALDRKKAGKMAPAQGLYLLETFY